MERNPGTGNTTYSVPVAGPTEDSRDFYRKAATVVFPEIASSGTVKWGKAETIKHGQKLGNGDLLLFRSKFG